MSEPAQAPRAGSLAQHRVGVKVQYIKDLSFEVPGAPEIYVAIRDQPAMAVKLDVASRPIVGSGKTHEVTLTIRVEATDPNAAASGTTRPRVQFIAELSYAGLFSVDHIPDDAVEEALLVECPHILYPFACNILADMTRDANFAPLQLRAVDFVELWQSRRAGGAARGRS